VTATNVSEPECGAVGRGGVSSDAAMTVETRPGATGDTYHARSALTAALLGFFTVTLDAVVVNVTLPSIRNDLGGGVAGLQWVVDGYTLMFAALLLSAGSLSDRLGAKRAFGGGLVVFVLASIGCGLASTLAVLVVARFMQGTAAAAMMPASMALIRQGYPDARARGRAVGIWAMGGAVASSSGPVLGGVLNLIDWRLIFFINVPAGVAAMLLLTRTTPSTPRPAPFDVVGQLTGVLGTSALTFAAIEAGSHGFTDPTVITAFAVAVAALTSFVRTQQLVAHPMMPLDLFRSRTVVTTVVSGFAFMVGYYGLPFVISLFLQQYRGLSALATGVVFLPMMLIGLVLTPFSARLGERIGRKTLIVAGLLLMTAGLVAVGLQPAAESLWLLAALMVLVGLGGPTVSPPATAVLLDAVSHEQAGVASGVFNTSRQLGGALAVAVFGGLLTNPATLISGMHTSLLIAAGVLACAAVLALFLPTHVAAAKEHS
jgi:MFS transporter, DHA2 family, methylenomycin A resistance protein